MRQAAAYWVVLGLAVAAVRAQPAPLPAVVAAPAAATQPADSPASPLPSRSASPLDAAIRKAEAFLLAQIGPDGEVRGEYELSNPRYGGKTALCLYALLTASDEHAREPVKRGMKWLTQAKLTGTYAVALRACALAAYRDRTVQPLLEKDVGWLIRAASRDGGYTYTSCGNKPSDEYDNSNSQMAVMGVWAGAQRGVEVPAGYWQTVQKHWLAQQQTDGGWGYLIPPGRPATRTYGSMTAAGLATLYVCFDALRREEFLRCTEAPEYKPVTGALDWLAKNFSVSENPNKGMEWHLYWLYCLERVGLACGFKYIGGKNWFAEGAAELLSLQRDDGAWGPLELAVEDTSFAVLFLARGRDPVLVNKLSYAGKWNTRPRDIANFTRFVSYAFERPVAWQVVSADAPLADLQDAPIVYISGAGPIELDDRQIERLRQFVQQGGSILSEAACNSGTFTLDMQKVYRRMFPDYPLTRLDDSHPLYRMYFTPRDMGGLTAMSNGVRLLAVHAPRELSLALQLGPGQTQRPWYELATNLYLHATDRSPLRPRGVSPWPALTRRADVKPAAVYDIVRLRHTGNWDPEPLAWKRLGILARNQHNIRIQADQAVEIDQLDPARHKLAVMTGTKAFTLTPAQTRALKTFLAGGGSLIADAAGGSADFVSSFEAQVFPLFPDELVRPLASHVAYQGVETIKGVNYRREFSMALGGQRHDLRLRAMLVQNRLAIVFSREDVTGALAGVNAYGIRGLTGESAQSVVLNLLRYLGSGGDGRRATD